MEEGKRKGRGMACFFLCMVVLLIFICLGQKKVVRANEDTDTYLDSQGVRYTLYDNHTCAVTGYTEPIKASVVIPEVVYPQEKEAYAVVELGDLAWEGCTALKEITIPNSITRVGADVFKGCKNLKRLSLLPVQTTLTKEERDAVLNIKINSGLLCSPATATLEIDKASIKEAIALPGTDMVTLQVLVKENELYQTEQAVLHQTVIQEAAIKALVKSGKSIRTKLKHPVNGFSCMKIFPEECKKTTGDLTLSFVSQSVNDLTNTYQTEIKKALKKNKLNEQQIKLIRVSSLNEALTADISLSAEGIGDGKTGSKLYIYRYQKSKKVFVHTAYDAYVISKKGNVTFTVKKSGIYLLSPKKLSAMAEPLRSQFFRQSGSTYYAEKNGRPAYGWRKIGGEYYYFDRRNGKMASSTTVDGIRLKADGTAKQTNGAADKIQVMIKARNIVNEVTNEGDSKDVKMQKCFRWIFQFPYHRYRRLQPIYQEKGWEVTFANDIFDHKKGCCVSEAAALAFLFHECGVETVYISHDTGHAWTEVGGRVYDPLFAEARGISDYYNVSYKQAGLHVAGRRKI